ncbi:MAG: exonuclease domain-containing protein, partial [Pseudomonadota bacterium]
MMDHKTDLLGVPLASLPAIVLDTETTGLDPSQDKVIEIGAVRLPCADVDAAEQFQTLVNPNRAVPPEATEIHGLADADVSGAPEFSRAFAAFKEWSNEGVIIGYAIAFDLAILRSECEGADMDWGVPQSLDLRQLLKIIEPEPIADSLEAAAERFGIAVVDRHRALGDALLTARIFNAAVPRLRAKGIRTFGEAHNAIRARIARRERLTRGEPAAITAAPSTGEGYGFAGFPRLDSFPYRHRISDLMSAPVVAVGSGERLGAALQTMMSRRISSIFVRLTDTGSDHGIITERDVLRAIADLGAPALDQPVANFAKRPLVSVHGHDFVYVALARMAQHHIRHLAV